MTVATEPMTVKAYAARRGVSHGSVQHHIDAGMLPTSTKRVGRRWVIVDVEKADAEWEANARPWVSEHRPVSTLAEATLRERRARAAGMELELARKLRDLVPAHEVQQRWAAQVIATRTALLGVPTRAKGRLPHLTPADLVVLEALIREVLVELAAEMPHA